MGTLKDGFGRRRAGWGAGVLVLLLALGLLGCGDPSPGFLWGRSPSWSPDGRTIAFSQHINDPTDPFAQSFNSLDSGFVWTIGSDGTAAACISQRGTDLDPDWSPDSTQLAFVVRSRTAADIWRMSADGSARTRLTDGLGLSVAPSWSPDGRYLAFASNRAGNWDIWVMNSDGSNPRQVTFRPADDVSPDWSPDSQQLVFASNADRGNWDLWLVRLDSGNLRPLTSKPEESRQVDGSPAWSPTGDRIAYVSWDGDWDVWVIHADGTSPRNLTNDPAHDGDPAWSPDGRKVVFTSGRTEWWHLYIMNADGTGVQQLTGQGE